MIDKFQVSKIAFLGEQDGPFERDLKRGISSVLMNESEVTRAYLVKVQYEGESGNRVILALEGGDGSASRIVETVGGIFKQLFNRSQSLDILFLNATQMAQVSAVAAPFYQSEISNFRQVN